MKIRNIFLAVILPLLLLFAGCRTKSSEFSVPEGNAPWQTVSPADQILKKEGFTIGFDNRLRQARWVSYRLTAENLKQKKAGREKRFYPDREVRSMPVLPEDYTRSGYDRGHLAAAADMAYSPAVMKESFLMSNISPQTPRCNRRNWKELETLVRQWAVHEGELLVITGTVWAAEPPLLKKSRIPVPQSFYKIIFDLTPPRKMIAFVVPNDERNGEVRSFAVTADQVEKLTGNDFFADMPEEMQDELEKMCDFDAWKSGGKL